jgi:hypothetical protein
MSAEPPKTKSDYQWEAFGHFGKILGSIGCILCLLPFVVIGVLLLYYFVRALAAGNP